MPNESRSKIINTLNKQNTMLDMVWYVLLYGAKNSIQHSGGIIDEGSREKYGLNPEGRMTDYDEETYDICMNKIKSNIAKDNTLTNIRSLYEALGIAMAYNEVNMGKEVYEAMNELPDEKDETGDRLPDDRNKKIKEMKAMYLMYMGCPFSSFVLQTYTGMQNTITTFCENNGPTRVAQYEGHPISELGDLLMQEVDLNKETTFKQLFDKQGIPDANRASFLANKNAKEEESVFEAYKRFYEESNKGKEPHKQTVITDQFIKERIKSDYYMFVENVWMESGKKKVLNGLSVKEREYQSLGNRLEAYNLPKELREWINDTGKDKAYEISGRNIVKGISNIYKPLYSGKPLDIMKNGMITGAFNDTLPEDTTYIRMIIKELVNTGKGSGTFHKNNSKLYEKMLASIKNYEDAVEKRNGGAALEYQKEMIRNCKDYIKDKETVRDSTFGKIRFNMTMTLLSRQLPEADFKTITDRVNRKRGLHIDNPDDMEKETYVSKEKYEEYIADNLNAYAREEDKKARKLQDASADFRTIIPYECRSGINAVDKLYGKIPERPEGLKEDKFDNEAMAKLKVYNEEFAPIGPHEENDVLSDKDFAAIAFAGALTPAAVRLGGKVIKQLSPEENLMMTGEKYSINFFSDNYKAFNTGVYADAIQYGREHASEAMKAYVGGDKAVLAGILTGGIKYLVETGKTYSENCSQLNGVGEMARRMTEMLERDKELKKFALRDGLTEKDIACVKAINRRATIYNAGVKANEEMREAVKDNAWQNEYAAPEARIELITGMVMNDLVNASIRKCEEERNKNTSYLADVERESADIKDHTERIIEWKQKGFLTEKAEEIMKDKIDVANFRMILAGSKYRVENHLINSLSDEKEYDKIKSKVSEVVKDAGLHNLSPKDLKSRYNSGDILKKIAVYTSLKPKAAAPKTKVAEPEIKMKEQKKKVPVKNKE